MTRRLNKSVLVRGVVYPAGASGPEVEAAVTNPAHWDGGSPAVHEVSVKLDPDQLAKVQELAQAHEQLQNRHASVLTAIAPLLAADPSADVDELEEVVFGDPNGIVRLGDQVEAALSSVSRTGALLSAVAPLVDVEPDESGEYDPAEIVEAIFGDDGGIERLAEAVLDATSETLVEAAPIDYSGRKKDSLEGEVKERNEGRPDDQKIVVEGKGTIPDLIAALQADDKRD